jgi:hypothetical protein
MCTALSRAVLIMSWVYFFQSKNRPHSRGEYNVYSTFQSHEPEFDYLKSLEIEEKINKIRWLPQQNAAHSLLSTNGKSRSSRSYFWLRSGQGDDSSAPQTFQGTALNIELERSLINLCRGNVLYYQIHERENHHTSQSCIIKSIFNYMSFTISPVTFRSIQCP